MIQEIDDKYYELIISLIKEHRKYNDCVGIVDDIAKDVLERSRIVVENINDDCVIEEYLKKAVANSMITVSRKLKFDTRKTKVPNSLDLNSNNNLIQNVNNIVDNSEIINDAYVQTVTQEYVDKMINTAGPVTLDADECESADASMQADINNNSGDADNESTFETFDLSADENILDATENETVEVSQDDISELETFDLSTDENILDTTENETAEVSQDDISAIETFDLSTDENILDTTENETVEVSQDDISELETFDLSTDENILDATENETAEVSQDDISAIETFDLSTDENIFDTTENESTELSQDDISDIELLEFNTDENTILNVDNDVAEINHDAVSDIVTMEFNKDDNKSEEISIYTNKQILSLCRFEASYSNEKLLAQDFIEELLAENAKQPELMLYKIWKLKFRNKLSVLEIANSLNKDKDEILISLNKIIDLAEK